MPTTDLIALLTRVQAALLASELRVRQKAWAELTDVIDRLKEESPC